MSACQIRVMIRLKTLIDASHSARQSILLTKYITTSTSVSGDSRSSLRGSLSLLGVIF